MAVINCNIIVVTLLSTLPLLLSLSLHQPEQEKVQTFRIFPHSQTVPLGGEVIFICAVTNKSGTLYWLRNEDVLAAETEIKSTPDSGCCRNYGFGRNGAGTYVLTIPHVTMEDEAEFQCQVRDADTTKYPITTPGAFLTVTIPPGSLSLSYVESGGRQWISGPRLVVQEGGEGKLECISAGGRPEPKITWLDTTGKVLPSDLTAPNNTLRASLNITTDRGSGDKSYICEVSQDFEKGPCHLSWVEVEVIISYPTEVRLKVENSTECGKSCFTCFVDKDPALEGESNVTLFRNGFPIRSKNLTGEKYELCLEDIAEGDDEVICMVTTQSGNYQALQKITNICPSTTTTTEREEFYPKFFDVSAAAESRKGETNAAVVATLLIVTAAFAALFIAVIVLYFRGKREQRSSPILGGR